MHQRTAKYSVQWCVTFRRCKRLHRKRLQNFPIHIWSDLSDNTYLVHTGEVLCVLKISFLWLAVYWFEAAGFLANCLYTNNSYYAKNTWNTVNIPFIDIHVSSVSIIWIILLKIILFIISFFFGLCIIIHRIYVQITRTFFIQSAYY